MRRAEPDETSDSEKRVERSEISMAPRIKTRPILKAGLVQGEKEP
jgi:hypothetical protein